MSRIATTPRPTAWQSAKDLRSAGGFESGDRVYIEFFGKGTVQPSNDTLKAWGLVSILWDTRPHDAYNCGQNPCAVHAKDLERVVEPKD